jgi:hypothetical protein
MPIQLTEDGLEVQTQTEINDEVSAALRAQPLLGPNVHLDPTESVLGQVVGVVVELEALTQQAMASLHRSMDRGGAIGRPLDARVGLTGTTRKGRTKSQVDGLLTFTGAATVPNLARYKHVDTNTIWEVTDGPHTRVGAGTEAATLTAIDSGTLEAAAASDWTNVTIIANVTGFTNPSEAAIKGRVREVDEQVRRRSQRELYSQGQGPLAAIEGAVLKVDGVVNARCYHNPSTSPTDSDGIPFKAINVVVETSPSTPTVDQQQAIGEAIFSALGGGGEAYGTDYTVDVVDAEGTVHEVSFDVVTNVDIWIEIDLVTSTSEVAVSPQIDEVVADAVLALALEEHTVAGRDVKTIDYSGEASRLLALGLIGDPAGITGVDGVAVRVGLSDPPAVTTKLSIGIRSKPSFDAARITVQEI